MLSGARAGATHLSKNNGVLCSTRAAILCETKRYKKLIASRIDNIRKFVAVVFSDYLMHAMALQFALCVDNCFMQEPIAA